MADPFNPTVPGLSYGQFPPEMQQEAASAQRRRAIADLMLQRMFQQPAQPTGYGGIPVPMSPFAGLNQLVSGVVGGIAQSRADKSQADLSTRYATGLAEATNQVNERIAAGDMKGASAIAARWPAMKTISEKLLERQLPQNVIHTTYGPGGTEQPAVVNLNSPSAPIIPIGGMKTPPLHPIETTDAGGQPTTGFVNLQDPNLAPMSKPVKLAEANLGGTTELFNPYGPERTIPHTIDPNKVPTQEDIEAAAKRIEEYRAPGFATSGGRASPWQMQVMRRVDELAAAKGKVYDSSVFPVVKAAEVEFNQKNAPVVRSFGTLVGHVMAAKELFTALDNPTDIQKLNQARNVFLQEFGYPAPGNVDVAKQFIADESVKAVLGAPGALDDRKAMAEKLSRASSAAQFNTDADTVVHFGVENMKNHLQQLKGMTKGKRAEEDFIQYLSPTARQAFFQYGGSDRRKGPQEGVAVPPSAPSGSIALPSASDIDAELARRAGGR